MKRTTPSAQRTVFSPAVLIGAIVLLAGALGLRPLSETLSEYFHKESIAIRKPLKSFDAATLASYRAEPYRKEDESKASELDLGTDEHLVKFFRPRDQSGALGGERFRLFVTYYSDPNDQVPHTPEVCYRQGGSVVDRITSVQVKTPDLEPDTPVIEVREMELTQGKDRALLLYLFCCNGSFYHDREQVRFAIGWPGDKYIYFSKVEVTLTWPEGVAREEISARCRHFMGEAIPELMRSHFPTRDDLTR